MKCNICKQNINLLFETKVLNKYNVKYYKCNNCGFIQTEKPYWLEESYSEAINSLDVGLVGRNIALAENIVDILIENFDYQGQFLDYAGGYGLFVRIMRDKGFDFYREDIYCDNIFAKNYDIENLSGNAIFEAVTAFEVFEHMINPVEEIKKILKFSDTLIFTTELQPQKTINSIEDWWYFIPETGQHVSFYSKKTLEYIASILNLEFFSNDYIHIFTRNKSISFLAKQHEKDVLLKSLLEHDFNVAKNIIDLEKMEINKKKQSKLAVNENKESVLQAKLNVNKIELNTTTKQLNTTTKQLNIANKQLNTTTKQLNIANKQLNTTTKQLNITIQQLNVTKNQLKNVYNSREWKIGVKLQKVFKFIFPTESLRRKVLVKCINYVKKCKRVFKKIKTFTYIFVKSVYYKLKQKTKRKININSKELVYVGHSYHNKTKSTIFLQNYLKKYFDLTVISDNSWKGDEYPNLSFINKNDYIGVVFFQILPPKEILDKIDNDNIIFCPMYDASGHLTFDYWNQYRDLKILNFSSTLHKKLKKWGFESVHIQYFPKVKEFVPGNEKEVFFWQRLENINIKTIISLLKNKKVSIHIHKAIDPKQKFLQPTQKQEEKYNITYSEWFDTREEMQEVVKQKGIYVAPREYEGIGQSFLEAMAMGKAVIGVNNPTMNEYIKNGETGYLFDLNNPQEIDLSNIAQVQKNAYNYMKRGRKQWIKDRKKIIEFIRKDKW